MKISRLLNKINLSILISLLLLQNSYSTEPVDIWNLEKKSKENQIISNEIIIENESTTQNLIFEIKNEKKNNLLIKQEQNLLIENMNITGIYDPLDNDLSIGMWKNSNGIKILEIIEKIQNINLSKDADDILNVALMTNSYYPKKNITKDQFLKIKSDWLIKKKNFDLIETYLKKNNNLSSESNLVKYYIDHYLSRADLAKSCDIFNNINFIINDEYISKFKIYCLINSEKNEEAQLLFDLLKEKDFVDNFYEKKFNYLMGYEENVDSVISEKTLLDFHLSHITNHDFKFEPKIDTHKLIWKYLSSSNLLENVDVIDLEDKDKIFTIEKATHEKNYKEEELFVLYKRFVFNINQLLNVKETYKILSNSEGRALLYQRILLTDETVKKIELIKLLKDSFEQDKITVAFEIKLIELLKKMDRERVPSNFTNFYNSYLDESNKVKKKIKFNNKIIHQSKLLNYFKEDFNNNVEKDLENLFKKIKKDKKYFFSIKDIIILESLKSDGFEIPKKYENIYEPKEANIPYDIQILINRNEPGLALLRLVEIIGEDNVADMGSETLYFIISTLNQLNIDKLRNKILLKVLPLKV